MDDLTTIYDQIYRYCFYKIRNSAAAEDITQEAFLRYFAQNQTIRRGEDMAYLYTIAKHLCVDYFRRKQPEELPEDYPGEEFAETSETKIAVRTAVEKLDERRREVIVLRYFGGLSVNETAETMGISRFAAYRLEKAALHQLRKALKGALRYET